MIRINIEAENAIELKVILREMLGDTLIVTPIPPVLDDNHPVMSESDKIVVQEQIDTPKPPSLNTTPGAGPVIDTSGLPWDERINSTAKSKNQNGTWKILRRPKSFGEDDAAWKAFIEQIKTELRRADNNIPANGEDVNTMFSGDEPSPTPDEPSPTPDEPSPTPDEPSPTPDEPSPTPDEPQQPITITEFTPFMTFITGGTLRIPMPDILAICNKYGAATLMELASKTSLIPAVYADIVALNTQALNNE